MTLPLQAVADPATDQNFRQIAEQFPIQPQNVANAFLGLAVTGKHKVAWGETTVKYTSAAVESTEASITHGLGTEKVFPFFTTAQTIGGRVTDYEITERTKTVFKFKGVIQTAFGSEQTITVLWLAIG